MQLLIARIRFRHAAELCIVTDDIATITEDGLEATKLSAPFPNFLRPLLIYHFIPNWLTCVA